MRGRGGGGKRGLAPGERGMGGVRVISVGPRHGYGGTKGIQQMREGTFEVQTGSRFQACGRLERAGLGANEWRATEHKRRAKYYRITESGKRQLKTETRDWRRQVLAIARILETS